MLIDLTPEMIARCERVTPKRELMFTQLMPGTVLYAEPNKSRIYRPHGTQRGKAAVFLWEPSKFDQDFCPAVGLSESEPLVMADEGNGEQEPPAPPEPTSKSQEKRIEEQSKPKAEESAPSTGVDDVSEPSAPPSGDEPDKPVAE